MEGEDKGKQSTGAGKDGDAERCQRKKKKKRRKRNLRWEAVGGKTEGGAGHFILLFTSTYSMPSLSEICL